VRAIPVRTLLALSVAVASFGPSPQAIAANALTPACTIAAAPELALGAAVAFDGSVCPNGSSWTKLNLTAGSVLTLDFNVPSGDGYGVWKPGTTDFNYGDKKGDVCQGSVRGFAEVRCQVTETGTWLVQLGTRFYTYPGTVTAAVKAAPLVANTFAGSCLLSTTAVVPSLVTQYAYSYDCSGVHAETEFWGIRLFQGDRVTVRTTTLVGQTANLFSNAALYPSGVTDYTIQLGHWVCGFSPVPQGPAAFRCPAIKRSGTYYLAAQSAISLTPTVTHAITDRVAHPSKTKRNKKVGIAVRLTSPAGVPAATCQLQLRAKTWKTLRSTRAVNGSCAFTVKFASKGLRSLRIHEVGAGSWATHNSATFSVRVR
jgi:hypothetical protein